MNSPLKANSDDVQALVLPSGKVRLTQFYVLTTYGQRSRGFFLPICEMRFASWTSGKFVITNSNNFDFSRYTPSMQWTRQRETFTVRKSFLLLGTHITFLLHFSTLDDITFEKLCTDALDCVLYFKEEFWFGFYSMHFFWTAFVLYLERRRTSMLCKNNIQVIK